MILLTLGNDVPQMARWGGKFVDYLLKNYRCLPNKLMFQKLKMTQRPLKGLSYVKSRLMILRKSFAYLCIYYRNKNYFLFIRRLCFRLRIVEKYRHIVQPSGIYFFVVFCVLNFDSFFFQFFAWVSF